MKKQILFICTVAVLQAANCILPTISCAQSILGGAKHSIAICNDGTLTAWGFNDSGQLGNGTNITSNIPVQVNSLTDIIAIVGGDSHSLAMKNDGTVWAWGAINGSNVPLQVSGLTGINAITGGYGYSVALKNDGTLWAWGNNGFGQLGNGTNTDSNVPVQVNSLTGVTAISGGALFVLALKNDGTVWAWGDNSSSQLGNGNNNDSNIPVQVSGLTDVIAISGGGYFSLALKNDGTVWAWGGNSHGELGNGNNNSSNVPVQVISLTGVTAISAGNMSTLALKYDGTVWAWGHNAYGTLGNGTYIDSNAPVQVSSLTEIFTIAGGAHHCFALKNDGTIWVWGSNLYGQFGNGTNTDSNVPEQATGLCQLATSCNAAFILLADTSMLHHYWALNLAIGVQPLSYYWSWGDGTYDSIDYPSHIYAAAGFYPICLTIHDSTGCTDSTCIYYDIQKLSAENTIVKVDVVDSIPSVPTTIENPNVLQSWSVFPNPAAGNSFINYTLSTPATVSIALYDVLGNKLQQIVNGNQEQGEHNATIDAHKLSNGVYVLQIRAGEQAVRRTPDSFGAEEKIVLLR